MGLITGRGNEFPPPSAFGLPDNFTEWRPHQIPAWQAIIDAPTRFVAMLGPTGAGKSLVYMTAGVLTDGKRVVLTSTKGLQDKLEEDYEDLGLVDVRGQDNYHCVAFDEGEKWHSLCPDDPAGQTCHHGPCHIGLKCGLQEGGCTYYDRLRTAKIAETLSTNYAWWFAQRRYGGGGIEDVRLLVLDEAHNADKELSNALRIEVPRWLLHSVGADAPPGADGLSLGDWKTWARWTAGRFTPALDGVPPANAKAAALKKRQQQVYQLCVRMHAMTDGDWITDHTDQAFVFECLNPKAFAEGLLFQYADKVVLTSATLTKKTLALLGVPEDQVTWYEMPSTFPVARRPVVWVPTVRVDNRMTDLHWSAWADRIDQIVGQRPDRKGIIHCVSYSRGKRYVQSSLHKSRLLMVSPGTTVQAVEKFRASKAPLVLVSPAVMTGWDFPDDDCRFQVISKLPFPDTRSKIVKAWQDVDKDWGPHQMMQNLVQAVGRGMRSEHDWCETLIVDDHWSWVWSKYKAFAPAWFWAAVRKSQTLPKPLQC